LSVNRAQEPEESSKFGSSKQGTEAEPNFLDSGSFGSVLGSFGSVLGYICPAMSMVTSFGMLLAPDVIYCFSKCCRYAAV
jgi:hypothetical protein